MTKVSRHSGLVQTIHEGFASGNFPFKANVILGWRTALRSIMWLVLSLTWEETLRISWQSGVRLYFITCSYGGVSVCLTEGTMNEASCRICHFISTMPLQIPSFPKPNLVCFGLPFHLRLHMAAVTTSSIECQHQSETSMQLKFPRAFFWFFCSFQRWRLWRTYF